MIGNRIQSLRHQLNAVQNDALLITNPENRRYMSGFTGSAGNILISKDRAILATDFRYIEQAQIRQLVKHCIDCNATKPNPYSIPNRKVAERTKPSSE